MALDNNLAKMNRLLSVLDEDTLTKKDFVSYFEQVVEVIKKVRQQNSEDRVLINSTFQILNERLTKEILEKSSALNEKLSGLVNENKEITRSEVRTITRMLKQEISRLEALIPTPTNLTPLQEKFDKKLKELEAKVPTLPEQPDIEGMIEDIKAEFKEELGKLKEEIQSTPRGRLMGGYTDNHVKFALGRMVKKETPSGDIDGANKTYTTTQPIHAVLSFDINGQSITDDEYTVSGGTITMTTAIPAALSGTSFRIVYI